MLLKSILLFSTILISFFGFTQKLVFKHIGVNDGLPASEVYNLFQDSKGYVWVFTEYGIVKHNGANFVRVCKNIPLKESAIYAVTESPGGEMYIANSKAKIYRIDKDDKAYPVLGIEQATSDVNRKGLDIHDILFDDQNTMWFSSYGDTYHYPFGKYSVKGIRLKKSQKKSPLRLYAVTKRLFYSETTVKKIALSSFGMRIIRSDGKPYGQWLENKEILGSRLIVRVKGKRTYFSFGKGILLYENGKIRKLKADGYVNSMEVAENGHVWVGMTNAGLQEFDPELNLLKHYFEDAAVSNILFDNQNGMWISTIGQGVFHCKNRYTYSYLDIPELRKSISLIKIVNNKLCIGTSKGRLLVQEGGKFKTIVLGNNVAVTDIAFFDGRYFIPTANQTFSVNQTFDDKKLDAKQCCYGVCARDSTKLTFVFDYSLGEYSSVSKKIKRHSFFSNSGKNRWLAIRNSNEIFVATKMYGVALVHNEKISFPSYFKELVGKNVTRLKKDQFENIWICTKGSGVYRLDVKNHLKHFRNLPSSIVNDISFTNDGLILLSTDIGAFVNSEKTIEEQALWRAILSEEIIRTEEYKNQVYIGTKNGLTVIDKDKLFQKKQHKLYLKSILVNQKKIGPKKKIVLNYDENNLLVSYDFLNFESKNTKLIFKLKGPNELEEITQSTKIRLQNLSPGEYTLKVAPHLKYQGDHPPTITTTIIIHPAFWQTVWFQVIVVVLLIGLIFLIALWIVRQNNKKIKAKEDIERLLTEYRLTALKAQVNPHFMSNSLVAIQHLILESETDKANLYIAKFSLLLRSLLDYSNRSSARLKDELTMIELYVELEQLRFSNKFLFELDIDPELKTDEIFIPALITQPFVENAIWHGLLPLNKSVVAQLILKVSVLAGAIKISIIDNGVGREFNKKPETSGMRESKGTALIVQRMENLNRLYQTKEGRIEFVDLKDEHGNPVGTQVNIVIPDEILMKLEDGENTNIIS